MDFNKSDPNVEINKLYGDIKDFKKLIEKNKLL